MDLHAECKFVLRQRIEALCEYYRVRLYLLREEQRNVAKEEKAAYGLKFKQLMEQFDAKKQKIKSELRSKHVNKEILKKHCIQINKDQNETLRLSSRLNAIKQLLLLDKKGSSSSQHHDFTRFTSSSSIESILPRSGGDKHEKNALTELISKYSVEGEGTKERGSNETLDVFEAIQASIHEGPPEQMTIVDNEPIPSLPVHIPPLDFTQLSDGGNPPNQQTTTVMLTTQDQAPLNGPSKNLDRQRLSYATEMEEAAYNDDLMNSSPQRSPLEMLADLAIRKNDAENYKDKASGASLSNKMIDGQQIGGAPTEVDVTLSELEESGGNTSEDITLIPYPSEAEKNQQAPARKQEEKQNQQQEELQVDNSQDSTMDENSEASFKPSDKSLRSILSSIQSSSSISTGRESHSRRRSSASEALIKLRLMNSIPVITSMSPRESKSPPKTPRSSLGGIERFMTKFPRQNVSREGSFTEEVEAMETSEQHELLDELPDTNELEMVLDLSQSSEVAEGTNINTSRIQITDGHVDKFAHQKMLIDKYADALWKEYEEKGADYDGDYPGEDADETIDENDENEDIMLRQLCCEYLLKLIQTARSNVASRHALSSKHELMTYLQEEVLTPLIDPQKFAVCSNGVRKRAEMTSHFLLSTNRLLAIQHLYETMTIWPDENLQREIDLCIIDKLNTK